MAGYIRQVEADAVLIHSKVIDKITREVQRRNYLMGELELVEAAGCDRQHIHLHLSTSILILLKKMQARLQVAVGRLQLFPVTPVFHAQARPIEGTTDRVLKHRQVFKGLDQVVGGAQPQSFDRITHHTGT